MMQISRVEAYCTEDGVLHKTHALAYRHTLMAELQLLVNGWASTSRDGLMGPATVVDCIIRDAIRIETLASLLRMDAAEAK